MPWRFARLRRDRGFDFCFPTLACPLAHILSHLVIYPVLLIKAPPTYGRSPGQTQPSPAPQTQFSVFVTILK